MQVEDIRPEGWACTYLIENDGKAVLIDPVWDYMGIIKQYLLTVNWNFSPAWQRTHMPITLRHVFPFTRARIPFYMWKDTASLGVTHYVDENTNLTLAGVDYTFHHVPGHTSDSMIIAIPGHIFTGDFLFNGGAGVGRDDLPVDAYKNTGIRFNHLAISQTMSSYAAAMNRLERSCRHSAGTEAQSHHDHEAFR